MDKIVEQIRLRWRDRKKNVHFNLKAIKANISMCLWDVMFRPCVSRRLKWDDVCYWKISTGNVCSRDLLENIGDWHNHLALPLTLNPNRCQLVSCNTCPVSIILSSDHGGFTGIWLFKMKKLKMKKNKNQTVMTFTTKIGKRDIEGKDIIRAFFWLLSVNYILERIHVIF